MELEPISLRTPAMWSRPGVRAAGPSCRGCPPAPWRGTPWLLARAGIPRRPGVQVPLVDQAGKLGQVSAVGCLAEDNYRSAGRPALPDTRQITRRGAGRHPPAVVVHPAHPDAGRRARGSFGRSIGPVASPAACSIGQGQKARVPRTSAHGGSPDTAQRWDTMASVRDGR